MACPMWTGNEKPRCCSIGVFLCPVLEWKGLIPQASYRSFLLSSHLPMQWQTTPAATAMINDMTYSNIDTSFPYQSGGGNIRILSYSVRRYNDMDDDKINSNLDSLKKSVADGKALIASAIRDKGVACGSDISFADIAANIRSINSVLKKADLGYGNSNNANNFSAAGIPNYNRLTVNNFVVSPFNIGNDASGDFNDENNNLTSGISYNSSNGILSVPRARRKGPINSSGQTYCKAYITYHVYCYYVG